MVVVRKEQFQSFKTNEIQKFIMKSIDWIKHNEPGWYIDYISQNDIQVFIQEMINFANENNIHQEASIQRLIIFKIRYAYEIPLQKDLKDILTSANLDESKRVDNFFTRLTEMFASA